jgi:NAD(P)-dependent dehydrogenase (short-subunit alcohol dehydrogenase family)
MDFNLSGKVAIVTGGSTGIGLACAKALYQEGVNLAIVARDPSKLEQAVQRIHACASVPAKVIAVPADLTQTESAEQLVSTVLHQFGHIDILINNAGAPRVGSFLDLDDSAYLDTWNLKPLGYIRLVKAVVPSMIERQDGRIVNIIGSAGRTPGANFLPGGMSNAALLNFTRGVSKELARYNIRISAISPGFTATDRANHLAEKNSQARGISLEDAKAELVQSIPLGRLVDPDHIAAMTVFLVSDLAASITGTEILIDGGFTPGM